MARALGGSPLGLASGVSRSRARFGSAILWVLKLGLDERFSSFLLYLFILLRIRPIS
jgi:hypothetical protein